MIQPTLVLLIKIAESWLLETNPGDEITTENFSNQARDVCLKPYNAFLSLQTYQESCETLYTFLRSYNAFLAGMEFQLNFNWVQLMVSGVWLNNG